MFFDHTSTREICNGQIVTHPCPQIKGKFITDIQFFGVPHESWPTYLQYSTIVVGF